MKIVVHAPTLTSSDDDRVAAAVLAAVRTELRRLDADDEADADPRSSSTADARTK
ncbi:hypothetical protein IC607_13520 [Cellulomonas sp. JH27-2]|uniref:hypothetical protein n=1 Tax=Cellulomonas sp. JH27-2 TaxID=2774139 RepID=UPI00178579E5|nr:hypothetical protein [Cellulomonas sp. JH27-2]MBD8059988.1 hypothetical protein [Cellulomonas sp. JH27-2]